MNAPTHGVLELDHLLYATPDVDATTRELEEQFGVAFQGGGRHTAWGTRNRLLPLGDDLYLEVIGPDETQPEMAGRRILGLDAIEAPYLAWYAVRPFLMPLTCGEFETAGYVPGELIQGHRELPDGSALGWQMTDPSVRLVDGLLPLVIEWDLDSKHPGASATPGVSLAEFRIEHPEASKLAETFLILGLPKVHEGEKPRLVAGFDTPNGRVELTG